MEEVKNEGPKEMTLDEWKAMQDKERTKVEFNIRKPNEGTDSQWKKGYVLHKSKSEDVSVRAAGVGICGTVCVCGDFDNPRRRGGTADDARPPSCPHVTLSLWTVVLHILIPTADIASHVGTGAPPHPRVYQYSAVFRFRGLLAL